MLKTGLHRRVSHKTLVTKVLQRSCSLLKEGLPPGKGSWWLDLPKAPRGRRPLPSPWLLPVGLSFPFWRLASPLPEGLRVCVGEGFARLAGLRPDGPTECELTVPCCPQNLVRWCDSSPCKNGGKCWQTNTLYRCECHSGWTGLYCDVPSVSCEVAAWQQGNWLCPSPAPRQAGTACGPRPSPGGEPGPHAPAA